MKCLSILRSIALLRRNCLFKTQSFSCYSRNTQFITSRLLFCHNGVARTSTMQCPVRFWSHFPPKQYSMTTFYCLTNKKTLTISQFYKENINTSNCLYSVKKQNSIILIRTLQNDGYSYNNKNRKITSVLYFCSVLIFMIGISYAAVPLYRLFCQATGLGGDPKIGHKIEMVASMEPVRERRINVYFNADHHATMEWNFKPSQTEITVVPGETALAFYTAKNPTDKPIIGIATYNVVPFQAGLYFNKIQCFCFEEQWLNPHEEVDMPVFFYIDPEFDNDPQLANTDDIVLSYTFFKAEEGQTLPLPGFMKLKSVVSSNDVKETKDNEV